MTAHICGDDTNEDDSRCAAPHGKVCIFPSVRPSVRRVSVCLLVESKDAVTSSSSALNTPQSFWTPLAGYRRNCES